MLCCGAIIRSCLGLEQVILTFTGDLQITPKISYGSLHTQQTRHLARAHSPRGKRGTSTKFHTCQDALHRQ